LNKIPFYLVTGFLGSGKTTFLKRILHQHANQLRIAIVQNEFAPANVDGIDLKTENIPFEILEINNGSVFCVCQLSSFLTNLSTFIKKHQPEVIILEASGLSDPVAIAQLLDLSALKENLYLAKVWTLVDASNYLKQHKLIHRLQQQVRIADVLIINKTDLVSEMELEKTRKVVQDLNPFARVLYSTFCDLDVQALVLKKEPFPLAAKVKAQLGHYEPCGRPDIRVGVLRTVKPIDKGNICQLIERYAPITIRIKGFIKLTDQDALAIQTSYDQIEYKKIHHYLHDTELIVMGENLKLSRLRREFKTCFA
jgi:G3E family GTPase